ncbi:hypothetical protein BdWA1_000574 [Babesia duncani]|uniref:Uncharacterized protein n=1 Tax=Babesia duncani TaxID=323732 RepID=A0AAD9PMK6_9APIC|nr:hypothetical protein BdWA1_000574 [Babesia duncani]
MTSKIDANKANVLRVKSEQVARSSAVAGGYFVVSMALWSVFTNPRRHEWFVWILYVMLIQGGRFTRLL